MSSFLDKIVMDSPSLLIGCIEILVAGAIYPLIFHLTIPIFKFILSVYSIQINGSKLLDISNKFVSAIFAIISVCVGLKVITNCGNNVMTEEHSLVRHYMCIGLPYFLYDIYSMYLVYAADQNMPISEEEKAISGHEDNNSSGRNTILKFCRARKIMVLHHLLIPFFGFPVFVIFRKSLGDCLISVGFCMEASTPFVSMRAILSHIGHKTSLIYVINGLLMNVVFFLCRICVFPYIYHLYANQIGLNLIQLFVQRKVPWFCTASMALLLLPQLYWFSLMIRGSIKVISRIRDKKSE